MSDDDAQEEGEAWWYGHLDAEGEPPVLQQLADVAKAGDWEQVVRLLGTEFFLTPNRWRPGGSSLYTPLHQAAWHGAPVGVVRELLGRGAWRTLRTADGRRALDIAQQRGHRHLVEVLTPPEPARPTRPEVLDLLDLHLADLVESRIRPHLEVRLRHLPCEVLTELPGARIWYPVPGMYGGFHVRLREHHLYVESWSRVAGGSGQAHVVTAEGSTLVDRGFV